MAPNKDTNETKKKEFGTGLRAQLERRHEEPEAAKQPGPQPNVELRFELTARPADAEPFTVTSDGATDELRKELAAAQAREVALKATLAKQQEVFEADMESDQGLARRTSTLDERDEMLAEFRAELQERERKFSSREADLKKEGARVAAKDEALGEREAELLLKQERLRGDLESLERDYSDKTAVVREAASRSAELDEREFELAAREAELNRLKAELAHAQRGMSFGADREQRAKHLEEREHELASRESALSSQEGLTDSQAKRQDRREKRLASMEDAIRDRIRELDEREGEVDQRQAALDADIDLRTDKIEVRESARPEPEAHPTQNEAELATYVGKAQTELQRREAVWWDKQLGREEAAGQPVEVDAA